MNKSGKINWNILCFVKFLLFWSSFKLSKSWEEKNSSGKKLFWKFYFLKFYKELLYRKRSNENVHLLNENDLLVQIVFSWFFIYLPLRWRHLANEFFIRIRRSAFQISSGWPASAFIYSDICYCQVLFKDTVIKLIIESKRLIFSKTFLFILLIFN